MLGVERRKFNEMEALIRSVTYLSAIMPQVKHLLSHLGHLMERANKRQDIFNDKHYSA